MRREGRQHGLVFTVDPCSLVDADGKPCRRSRAVQVDGTAAANGGFVRAPRKPTNHSKPAVGRAYKALIGKGETAGSGKGTGRHKFKHDEARIYHLDDLEGAHDAYADAMWELGDDDAYEIMMLDMAMMELDRTHCQEV